MLEQTIFGKFLTNQLQTPHLCGMSCCKIQYFIYLLVLFNTHSQKKKKIVYLHLQDFNHRFLYLPPEKIYFQKIFIHLVHKNFLVVGNSNITWHKLSIYKNVILSIKPIFIVFFFFFSFPYSLNLNDKLIYSSFHLCKLLIKLDGF